MTTDTARAVKIIETWDTTHRSIGDLRLLVAEGFATAKPNSMGRPGMDYVLNDAGRTILSRARRAASGC